MSLINLTTEDFEVLGRVFQHPAGPEARDILELKFCNRTSFNKDPITMAFLEGQRSIALALCAAAQQRIEVADVGQLDMDDIDNEVIKV